MNLKKLKSLTRLGLSNVTGKTFIYGISVKLTEKCPMNCVYCYEKKQFEEVEYKKLILFFKKYIKKGLYTVILSGGDPYDYSKIESLINFLKKHGLYIIFNTSGYYIKNEKFRKILKNVDELQLSLDGRKEINALTRGDESYQKALETLQFCFENKIKTTISCVLNKYNTDKSNIDFFMYLKKKYNTYIDFEKLSPEICQKSKYENLKPEESKLKDFLYFVQKKKLLEIPEYLLNYIKNPVSLKCRSYKNFLYISNNGEIYPCVDKIGNKKFLLGDISKGIKYSIIEKCNVCYCNTLVLYNLMTVCNFPYKTIIKKWLY